MRISLTLAVMLTALTAAAQRLAPPFRDGMVVAKGQPVRIFGSGRGPRTVSLAGHKVRAHREGDGWMAVLPALDAGGPFQLVVTCRDTTMVVHDVYVGTVIMAAGQSNMQLKLKACNAPDSVRMDDPLLRSFSLPHVEPGEPYTMDDGWVRCTSAGAADWSAIGYLVARELRTSTGEAVGVVNCYHGASVIESWMPREVADQPAFRLPDAMRHRDHFHKLYSQWNSAGCLYDTAVRPFCPYGVNCVVWYQGESNTGQGEAAIYPAMAAALVQSWREAFRQPALPFVMIQIADYDDRDDAAWHGLQQSQFRIPQIVDGVSVVASADVCESDNIHPPSKGVLAHRVAEQVKVSLRR